MKILLSILVMSVCYGANIPTDSQVLLNIGNSSQIGLPSEQIQVLVWNLHKGKNKDFEKDFISLSQNKDLIITQEILLDTEMKIILSELPDYQFSSATSFLVGKELFRTGVAIASQAPIVTTQFIRTLNLEPFLHTPKMTLINRYPLKNSKELLTVINLHAINFVSSQIFKAELDRIYQVIGTADFIGHPLLLTGDFNTWSEERIKLLDNLKAKMNLLEAVFSPDNRLTFNNFPLDHVFYSSDLSLISAKSDSFYQGSDHKPLELIFKLKNL